MASKVNDRQVEAMGAALRDFGYPELTDVEVRDTITALEADPKPKGVIAMFIKGWLEDAGLLGKASG